uniref:EF-hand domain-containing protein n=1 Tax=Strongyloides stercoralis TaxID=6248 RepID=A0AAF5I4H0_STRER
LTFKNHFNKMILCYKKIYKNNIMFVSIFIVFFVMGFLLNSLYYKYKLKYNNIIKEDMVKVIHVKHSLHNIKNKNCMLPKLDLWNSITRSYLKSNNKIFCGIEKNDWLFFDMNTQQLNVSDEIKEYQNKLNCKIKYINRINNTHSNITQYRYFKSKYFMRTILNNEKVKKLRKIKKPNNWTGWNVQIISYGSLSQMSYKRFLPKSLKFFEKTLKGFIMEGYNNLGNQTLHSFIPFFTGKYKSELLNKKKLYNKNLIIDDIFSFIWKNFSDIGYVTLFGEDSFKNSTLYNYLKNSNNQPTDHFLGTSFGYTETLFGDYCFRDTIQHKEWLDYSTSFIEAYNNENIPRFSFLHHSSLSTNFLTKGGNIDDDLYEYLVNNYNRGNFKNDFIVFISDIGYITSDFRNTQQGRLEERLPFLGIRLPENFKNIKYKNRLLRNLDFNRNVLITPFDIYATLFDILSLPNDYKLDTVQSLNKRGLSIIRPININRNCLNADIELHWCTCMEWKSISDEKKYIDVIVVLAKKYIKEINKILLPESKYCSPLKLDKIIDAQWLVPNREILINNNILNKNSLKFNNKNFVEITEATYKIEFTTKPGGTTYEITTRLNFDDTKMYVNMWNLNHINSNHNISYCIKDKVEKLLFYCVCYDKVSNKN